MKSLSFLVITIFAIILTSILTACGQKDTKVIPSVSKTASFWLDNEKKSGTGKVIFPLNNVHFNTGVIQVPEPIITSSVQNSGGLLK